MARSRSVLAALVVAALSAGAASAHAQPAARDPVTAEALFVEGKRLMQAKDYAGACPKLAESQRLDPSGGTIFALALCYEGAGKTATAWATFNDALSEARRDQRADREAAAAEHVKALEQHLTRVKVDVPHPVPGIEVTRNGAPVGQVLWGTPIPIDPGRYTFEAHAPGKQPWTWATNIDRPGDVFAFQVPELSNIPSALAVGPAPAITPVMTAPVARKRNWIGPEIALGVTVVGLAVGAGLGAAASSEWSTAQSDKTSARVNEASKAGTEADVATGCFVVGGVAAATGAVLLALVLRPDDSHDGDPPKSAIRVTPSVGLGSFGLTIGGAL